MCRNKNETVYHTMSECSVLVQGEYKQRHDNVARYVHLDRADKWYNDKLDGVTENVDYNFYKIL